MTYTVKAIETRRATKEVKGIVGIALTYSEKKDAISAIVRGIRVPLYRSTDNRASFSAVNYSTYERESEAFKSSELASAQRYLDAKYCIRQKDYDFLVNLAKSGKCLMTKAEIKALKEEKTA